MANVRNLRFFLCCFFVFAPLKHFQVSSSSDDINKDDRNEDDSTKVINKKDDKWLRKLLVTEKKINEEQRKIDQLNCEESYEIAIIDRKIAELMEEKCKVKKNFFNRREKVAKRIAELDEQQKFADAKFTKRRKFS